MRMNKSLTYIELGLQSDNVVAEHVFDHAPGCFTAGDIDPLSHARSNMCEARSEPAQFRENGD